MSSDESWVACGDESWMAGVFKRLIECPYCTFFPEVRFREFIDFESNKHEVKATVKCQCNAEAAIKKTAKEAAEMATELWMAALLGQKAKAAVERKAAATGPACQYQPILDIASEQALFDRWLIKIKGCLNSKAINDFIDKRADLMFSAWVGRAEHELAVRAKCSEQPGKCAEPAPNTSPPSRAVLVAQALDSADDAIRRARAALDRVGPCASCGVTTQATRGNLCPACAIVWP